MDNMMNDTKHIWVSEDSRLLLLKQKSKSVDLILTDPMYDLPNDEKMYLHQYFLDISRGGVIVFSPPENQWILPADQYLFWIKPISTKNTSKRYSRFVEMIFLYETTSWNCDRHWSQYTNVFWDLVDNASLHPFRKPPSLIERLILNHSNKGDTILDPFAGSGVVEDCCRRLRRNSISWEREERYRRDK